MQHMHNTPSNRPSSNESQRFGKTSTLVQRGIVGTSVAAIALLSMFDRDEQPAAQVPTAKAVSPDDREQAPVSALKTENAVMDPQGDAVVVRQISFAAVTPQKSIEQKKGPLTIDELPEGEIVHGTVIKLVDENGDTFMFATAENGDVLVIDGQRFKQFALASKKAFGGFSVPLGEHDIRWHRISKRVVDGQSMFEIKGGQKGEEADTQNDEVSLRSQKDLATLARNAKANGKFEFALPKKNVTGVGEVTLVGKIVKVEQK